MNERIRELAGQAGFETEHHKWIFANDNAGEGECHELLEKFAELIVLECTDKMYKVMQKTEQTDLAYNAMLTAIIADIHQSFNIKDSKADQFTRAMENAFKNGIDLSGQETP